MITQFTMLLDTVSGHPLYSDSAYRLYAYLLEQLNPDDALWLHETGNRAISQSLLFDRGNDRYIWEINLLSDAVTAVLRPVLEELREVRIENQVFTVTDREKQEVTLDLLLQQGREAGEKRTRLSFDTLTSFKQSGRYVIFPQERLILQSLFMRWNEVFPMCPLEDEDAFNAMLAGIHIVDYQLRSSRFFLKGVRIPGYTGYCVMEAKLALPLLELWNTLMVFANYAGIGIKTGLGMGRVRTQHHAYGGSAR